MSTLKKPVPFGKYYLLERINVGGMAEVFKAKTFGVEGFERLLAVKRILPNIAEDEEFITMFIDEAKIAVQLQHANIAQIFDLGKVDDSYFIALEYVNGRDLRSIFDRMRSRGEALPIALACHVMMQVCEGLDYAHNKRDGQGRELHLIHRDISPQNVLIGYDGEVKLIDFGIAKAAGKASTTQAGILKGKFGYMSPEQVRGLPIDKRSDIFAVGIVLYELLTGERLFVGETDFSTLEKVLGGRRPFTLATTVRLEEALGVSLRKPDGVGAVAPTNMAPGDLGFYSRPAVSWIEGSYLTLRPSFSDPQAIFAYRTEILWDDGGSCLIFRESERVDAEFSQQGLVSVPHQSGYIYLVTNRQGQYRLVIISRPTINLMISSRVTSAARCSPTNLPSRNTETSSAISKSSFILCVM